jgi:hypothetical protein
LLEAENINGKNYVIVASSLTNDASSPLLSSASRKLHTFGYQILRVQVFPSLHSLRLKIKQLTSRNLKRNIFL